MGTEVQDAVCAFVREIIEARTGEPIQVTDRPEVDHRSGEVVDERWESASHRYAVEHTRVESYDGQIENEARLSRLIGNRGSGRGLRICARDHRGPHG